MAIDKEFVPHSLASSGELAAGGLALGKDGTLWIADKVHPTSRQASVYTLPINGGSPKRYVLPKAPGVRPANAMYVALQTDNDGNTVAAWVTDDLSEAIFRIVPNTNTGDTNVPAIEMLVLPSTAAQPLTPRHIVWDGTSLWIGAETGKMLYRIKPDGNEASKQTPASFRLGDDDRPSTLAVGHDRKGIWYGSLGGA